MADPQAPAHWSKDFVEHLRTVHFTLVALCIGLVVLASFPSKSQIQTAHDQVADILTVTNSWNPSMFADELAKQQKKVIESTYPNQLGFDANGDISAKFILTGKGFSFRPGFLLSDWSVNLDVPAELQTAGAQPAVAAPGTLKLFEKLWDATRNSQLFVPEIPKECIAGDTKYDAKTKENKIYTEPCDIKPLDSSAPAEVESGLMALHGTDEALIKAYHPDIRDQSGHRDWPYEFSNGLIPVRPFRILPVRDVTKVDFDGQRVLTRLLPGWASKYNHSFKDAFRELAAVYGPLQDVPLASAELILDGEAKRTGDTFEAAGLKIPADLAVRCGVLLILGVQLYMLIHLREFGSRLDRDPGFEVAWIGVYTSQLARAMLLASLLLLPACTVILLSVRGYQMTESRWLGWTIAVGSNVASILLSTLIFRALPDQPEPPAKPPQPPKDREVSESLAA